MALRPEDRAWLTGVQSSLMTAVGRAETYAGAVRLYLDEPPAWWRLVRRRRARRGLKRAERLYRMYDDEAERCASLIAGWLAVYEVTTGETRGPIMTPAQERRFPYHT